MLARRQTLVGNKSLDIYKTACDMFAGPETISARSRSEQGSG